MVTEVGAPRAREREKAHLEHSVVATCSHREFYED